MTTRDQLKNLSNENSELGKCIAFGREALYQASLAAKNAGYTGNAFQHDAVNSLRYWMRAWITRSGNGKLKDVTAELIMTHLPDVKPGDSAHVLTADTDPDMPVRVKELLHHARKGKEELRKFMDLLPSEEAHDILGGLILGEIMRAAFEKLPD